jgi:preprotein translocase subunit SecF
MEKTGHPTAYYDEVKKQYPLYFNIVKKRYWWFAISLLIIIPGIISFFMQGLNLGIDYKGGSMLDLTFNQTVKQSAISDTLNSVGLGGSVQLSDGDTTALIRTEALDEGKRSELLTALESQVGAFDKANLKEDLVGPAMGQELVINSIYALLIAFGLMIVYITFRFRFDFAACGILGLVHDVLVVVGIFSLFQWEIDATFVAAILTIVGYSINDTIVIFDRIRENEPKMRRSDNYEDMVDKSIWQNMRRSINTSVTVLLALLALFILGGESTKMFSLAMIIGVFSGAYSSIFVVSQLYLEIRKRIKKNPRKGGKAVHV